MADLVTREEDSLHLPQGPPSGLGFLADEEAMKPSCLPVAMDTFLTLLTVTQHDTTTMSRPRIWSTQLTQHFTTVPPFLCAVRTAKSHPLHSPDQPLNRPDDPLTSHDLPLENTLNFRRHGAVVGKNRRAMLTRWGWCSS